MIGEVNYLDHPKVRIPLYNSLFSALCTHIHPQKVWQSVVAVWVHCGLSVGSLCFIRGIK